MGKIYCKECNKVLGLTSLADNVVDYTCDKCSVPVVIKTPFEERLEKLESAVNTVKQDIVDLKK